MNVLSSTTRTSPLSFAKFPCRHLLEIIRHRWCHRDSEMLITASDDFTLKIWRSRARAKRLGLAVDSLPNGVEYRRRSRRPSSRFS